MTMFVYHLCISRTMRNCRYWVGERKSRVSHLSYLNVPLHSLISFFSFPPHSTMVGNFQEDPILHNITKQKMLYNRVKSRNDPYFRYFYFLYFRFGISVFETIKPRPTERFFCINFYCTFLIPNYVFFPRLSPC